MAFSSAPSPKKGNKKNYQEGSTPSMHLLKLFPYALALCLTLVCSMSALAQGIETRERLTRNTLTNELTPISDDPIIISLASPEEIDTAAASTASVGFKFRQLMSSAIDQRLGSPYSWGANGPFQFDCSGFVWSTFQSTGIEFERSNARTLWARFASATSEENFKFGTLVFFNGLKHIGIVADEHGFYHASRRHGVVYSPFSDYWLSRIDGFRRVPLPGAG
ncbi:MAG: NlpC/P60 family protein [Acidobacteriota bacterium]|nr:NlpC/P60 family protein [Acidobacteriota bacterium]